LDGKGELNQNDQSQRITIEKSIQNQKNNKNRAGCC